MRKFFRSFKFRFFCLVVVVGMLAVLFREVWLPWPGYLLERDDAPRPGADAIFLLMGAPAERTAHAADLYKQGLAPRIVLARPENDARAEAGIAMNDGEATVFLLGRYGVPKEAIDYLPTTEVTSTVEEGRAVLDHVLSAYPGARRVVVVTSWYHSSRAHWALSRLGYKSLSLEMSPAETPRSSPRFWWRYERSFLQVFEEYLKWLYYLINH